MKDQRTLPQFEVGEEVVYMQEGRMFYCKIASSPIVQEQDDGRITVNYMVESQASVNIDWIRRPNELG